ncbi:hypothetical protein [Alloactinosynnema sp. L-07]|nr:hypothetical protein [Alloactinosynnema sp. L-07]
MTVARIRELAMSLPRTEEALVRDRVKFRVRGLVYLALSPDETELGLAYPKLERAALIEAEPDLFFMPIPSDERFNWVRAHLAALEHDRMEELVIDAWRMVVPKGVAADHLARRSTSLD